MIIRSLRFEGFRNLADGELDLGGGVNVVYGTNAQGKTNLVEAIWLLSGNRSFRGSKDQEFIRFGSTFAKIHADFFLEGRDQSTEIVYAKGKKEAFINGIKQSGSSALLGTLRAVAFSPEHLSLVKSGPAERRSFIDSAICQIKPRYKDALVQYKRILLQRNTLLKDIASYPSLGGTLDAWDERISSVGASIIMLRLKYIKKLSECAAKYHLGISEGRERLDISYVTDVDSNWLDTYEVIRDYMLDYLSEHRKEDIGTGFTSIGPHRDDIGISINGESARVFGSQGQQRSCVLSMKIAEAELLKIAFDDEPVVLLDDVLSELDARRQEFLLNEIADRQVFITCCEIASAERLKGGTLFEVSSGNIKRI